MSDTAAKRQPRHTGIAESAAGRREPVSLARRIEVLPQRAAATGRGSRLGIHDNLTHQPKVDDEAPVTDAMSSDSVSATANCDGQIGPCCERDRCDDVVDVQRPRDERRPPIEHPVERRASGIECHPVVGADHRAAMPSAEIGERQLFDNGHAAS